MSAGSALAEAAETLIGTPFRLHGRDPRTGLDCVGLVAVSLDLAGMPSPAPNGYRLRQHNLAAFMPSIQAAGFTSIHVRSVKLPGDLLIVAPSAGQFHAALIGSDGQCVHAHAGLRRVISNPASFVQGDLQSLWRL